MALAEIYYCGEIQKAKCSGNHQPVRNNFSSVRIALQSSRRQRWPIVYKDVGLLLIGD
jgi:hypothetical protein